MLILKITKHRTIIKVCVCRYMRTLSIDVKVEEGLREPSSVVGNLKYVRIESSQIEDELSQPTH